MLGYFKKVSNVRVSKQSFIAFGALLAVAALFPVLLIALGVLLGATVVGMAIAILWGPALAGLYPYFFVGQWVNSPHHGIHRYLDWPYALPLTMLHLCILAAIFSLFAKHLRGCILVAVAVVFVLSVAVGTHLVCTAAGIPLPLHPMSM